MCSTIVVIHISYKIPYILIKHYNVVYLFEGDDTCNVVITWSLLLFPSRI